MSEKVTHLPKGIPLTVNICPTLGTGPLLGLLLGLLGGLCWPLVAAGVVAHDETGATLDHFDGVVEK
jgi:hypothetical protein